MKKKILISWAIVIGIMLTIFIFSNQASETSSNTSTQFINCVFQTNFSEEIGSFIYIHKVIRKLAHFTIYALLGLATYNALFVSFKKNFWKILLGSILISFLYAISDEFHQLFIAGRSAEVLDVLLDTTGAAVGGLIIYLFTKIRAKFID